MMFTSRRVYTGVGVLLLALPMLLFVVGQLGFLQGHRPSDLGARNGLLNPPRLGASNVVSSQAGLHPHTELQVIEPLRYSGDAAAAMDRLVRVLRDRPGTRLVTQGPNYLHFECETRWLRFVDDLEFLVEPGAQQIHMRSASRLGRRDFGVNRARLEQVRQAFAGA